MKKLFVLVVFCLSTGAFVPAQSALPELEKIKQIKLLESTREDIEKIFGQVENLGEDAVYTDNAIILFFFATGNCSDEFEEWNVSKDKVTEIYMIVEGEISPADLRIDLSKLDRISNFAERKDVFVYYDKTKGISYATSVKEISHIKFIPSEDKYPALCSNKMPGKSYSVKEWFLKKTKQRRYIPEPMVFANVDELILNKTQLIEACATADSEKINTSSDFFKIMVETKASSIDPTDVLNYGYMVSAGKIVGSGASVVWDLSGVKPGKYTITAGVDNGCGVCGATKTEEVVVREYPDCAPKRD